MAHAATDPRIHGFLPLKPAWFHILLALGDGAQHGYAIRARAEERSGGTARLWPATLYGSIHQMVEEGFIEALEGEADPDDDARRQYYRLTPLGRDVLRAEASRLEALVLAARTSAELKGA
jgi:DNA-binding PadR family transcriptional regulator